MNAMVTSTHPAVLRPRPCDAQASRSLILAAALAEERGFLRTGAKFVRSISAYDQSMR